MSCKKSLIHSKRKEEERIIYQSNVEFYKGKYQLIYIDESGFSLYSLEREDMLAKENVVMVK